MIRLELMLEDASIKLSAVVSSLKTVSSRTILAATTTGWPNSHADSRSKARVLRSVTWPETTRSARTSAASRPPSTGA